MDKVGHLYYHQTERKPGLPFPDGINERRYAANHGARSVAEIDSKPHLRPPLDPAMELRCCTSLLVRNDPFQPWNCNTMCLLADLPTLILFIYSVIYRYIDIRSDPILYRISLYHNVHSLLAFCLTTANYFSLTFPLTSRSLP